MPRYTFKKKNGKMFIKEMNMSERETYLKDNPSIKQVVTPLNLVDAVRIGVTQPPRDFTKHILGRMAESIPQNKIRQNAKRFHIPKEI